MTLSGKLELVQIIEMRTSKVDELMKTRKGVGEGDGGQAHASSIRSHPRSQGSRSVPDPGLFDSYGSAMVNSNLPQTDEIGPKQAALLDGPMRFTDLDVIDDSA